MTIRVLYNYVVYLLLNVISLTSEKLVDRLICCEMCDLDDYRK